MARSAVKVTLAIAVLSPSGCGTITNFTEGTPTGFDRTEKAAVYGGLNADLTGVAAGFGWAPHSGNAVEFGQLAGIGALSLLDLPFSFLADTLTLPLTLCGFPRAGSAEGSAGPRREVPEWERIWASDEPAKPTAPPAVPSVALIRDGSVAEISHVPLATGQTVSAVLSAVGGVPDGEVSVVWVERAVPGREPLILPVDCAAIRSGTETRTDYRLEPGDRIYITPHIVGGGELVRVTSILGRLERYWPMIKGLFEWQRPDGDRDDSPR